MLYRWVAKPLSTLSAGAKRIEAGDLNHQIPVRGKDEIGQLARRFNHMALSRDEIFEKVQAVLVEALGVEDDEVTPTATLQGDLGADQYSSEDLFSCVVLLHYSAKILCKSDLS